MTPAERNHSVTEEKCVAIVFAYKTFDKYLHAAAFAIQTDHPGLTWVNTLKNPAGRLARWAPFLARYNYSIGYRMCAKEYSSLKMDSKATSGMLESTAGTRSVLTHNLLLSTGAMDTNKNTSECKYRLFPRHTDHVFRPDFTLPSREMIFGNNVRKQFVSSLQSQTYIQNIRSQKFLKVFYQWYVK